MNAVIFRTASLASHAGTQYAAYYDDSAHVVLASRRIGSARWTVARTPYTNDVADALSSFTKQMDTSESELRDKVTLLQQDVETIDVTSLPDTFRDVFRQPRASS